MPVEKLSDNWRRELRLIARREVGRVSECIRMVFAPNRGYTMPQTAEIFNEAAVPHRPPPPQD